MSLSVCPKCKGTVQHGLWEVVSQCPNCGEQWPVEPNAPEKMTRKIVSRAWMYGFLSFVPVAGIVCGFLGLLWGFLAASRQKLVTATAALLLSSIVGLVGQPFLAYWAYGYAMDRTCESDLAALTRDIAAYRDANHALPKDLETLAKTDPSVPRRCRAGGGAYLYLPPLSTQPESAPADDLLLVMEAKPTHRQVRMCVTRDLQMRAMPHGQFQPILERTCLADMAEIAGTIRKYTAAKGGLPENPFFMPEDAAIPGASREGARSASKPTTRWIVNPRASRAGGGKYLYIDSSKPVAVERLAEGVCRCWAHAKAEAIALVAEFLPGKLAEPPGPPMAGSMPAGLALRTPMGPADKTLLMVERAPGHGSMRTCITRDGVARAFSEGQLKAMLSEPYNRQFQWALDPIKRTSPDGSVREDPDFRFMGMSPKQLVLAASLAIFGFCVVCTWLMWRSIRKTLREAS